MTPEKLRQSVTRDATEQGAGPKRKNNDEGDKAVRAGHSDVLERQDAVGEEQDAAKRSKTASAAEARQALSETKGISNLNTANARGKDVFGWNRAQELRDALRQSRAACSKSESDKAQSMNPQDSINTGNNASSSHLPGRAASSGAEPMRDAAPDCKKTSKAASIPSTSDTSSTHGHQFPPAPRNGDISRLPFAPLAP